MIKQWQDLLRMLQSPFGEADTILSACCAVRQVILWPGYLIYMIGGAETVQRISDFFDIGANRQPVRHFRGCPSYSAV